MKLLCFWKIHNGKILFLKLIAQLSSFIYLLRNIRTETFSSSCLQEIKRIIISTKSKWFNCGLENCGRYFSLIIWNLCPLTDSFLQFPGIYFRGVWFMNSNWNSSTNYHIWFSTEAFHKFILNSPLLTFTTVIRYIIVFHRKVNTDFVTDTKWDFTCMYNL